MPRKQNTIHYLYKITCLITGRYYIGMHSTYNLDDGYMGSGKKLRRSLRKYGKENHVKEIIQFFNNREELVIAEKNAITEDMLRDVNCMNLMSGGTGGCYNIEHINQISKLGNKVYLNRLSNDIQFRESFKKRVSILLSNTHKSGKIKYDTFTGKQHSEETKQRMSETKKGKKTGSDNSQYGTMWITNGQENRKVKKNDVMPEGWKKGRIFF
jgi:hypothetical protein